MRLKKYRVTAGHYRIAGYEIYKSVNPLHWQVRDKFDDLIEHFPTLRQALNYAKNG